MARPAGRLAALSLSTPFLPSLVEAVRGGVFWPEVRASDPLSLASATIYVPGRRAARALRRAFLDGCDGATLLPRILAIADLDDDAVAVDDPAERVVGLPEETALPLGGLARQLAVMRLMEAWPTAETPPHVDGPVIVPCSPADAAHLAADLIRLMDEVGRERADWAKLDTVLDERLTAYWGVARDFLQVAIAEWPRHLARIGAVDAAEARDRMIVAEAQRLRDGAGPVLVVASPSYVPAQAELAAAALARPDGVVLLPGLDPEMDDEAWQFVRGGTVRGRDHAPDHGHAQAGLCHLLEHLRVPRGDVEMLGAPDEVTAARDAVLREALRPAETTDRWSERAERLGVDAPDLAFRDVTLMEAANEREEALAVAVSLRGALAAGHERIALVTPDRVLARRVEAELRRWGLDVDDSGGRPLGSTPPAILARALAAAVEARFAPVPTLAVLKHPLARPPAYEAPGSYRADVGRLERIALRGLAPDPGLGGIARRLDDDDERRLAGDEEVRTGPARRVLASLEAATDGLRALFADTAPVPLAALAAAHRDACVALAGDALWEQEDGEALASLFDGLVAHGATEEPLAVYPRDYPALFTALLSGQAVRRRRPSHPRIAILGLLEARQLAFDHCILAGLNEGTWPGAQRNDAWLSRPMRAGIGLPPPEKRLGEAAHDFAQGFASRHLVLSRALRSGGAPTIAARWLQRLDAVAGDALAAARLRGAACLDEARMLDRAAPARAIARPNPRPPLEARPRKLSITEIETWVRDPYSIYARHVLKLRALDPLDDPAGPRQRGTVIHAALEAFAAHDPAGDRAPETLRALMDAALEPYLGRPEVAALWRRQMHAIADWVCGWETERREGLTVHAELGGAWALPGDVPFVLTGRADRVEIDAEGRIGLVDYKTGNVPTPAQMARGFSPQLALGAAMARAGAFDAKLSEAGAALEGREIGHLTYVELKGTRDGNAERPYKAGRDNPEVAALVDETVAGLLKLVAAYEDPAQGYAAMPRAQWRLAYGDYDHLARVREWALADDAAGEAS